MFRHTSTRASSCNNILVIYLLYGKRDLEQPRMENIPVEQRELSPTALARSVPRLDDLIARSAKKSGKKRNPSRSTQVRTLSPLNFGGGDGEGHQDHDSQGAGPAGTGSQDSPRAASTIVGGPAIIEHVSATPSVRGPSSDFEDYDFSSRKRARQPIVTASHLSSPNPKARKQQKVLPKDGNEEPVPRASSLLRFDPIVCSTPIRHTRSISNPKIDRTPKVTDTTAGNRDRRRSAPPKDIQQFPLPSATLDTLHETQQGGTNITSLPEDSQPAAPRKPIPPPNTSDIKEEEAEPMFNPGSNVTGQQDISQTDAGAGPSTTTTNLTQQPNLLSPTPRPEPHTRGHISQSPWRGDDDFSFMSAHPEADSSFTGMEIDSDEDVAEFTVPLRLDSPPPRRRRSSAVAKRQPTPGIAGPTKSPARATPVSRSPASILRQLSPAKRSILGSSTATLLKFPPITPASRRASMLPTTSPYPSPKFRGDRLGSLSPEKGRGPSRGSHPKLDDFRPGSSSFEEGDPDERPDLDRDGSPQPNAREKRKSADKPLNPGNGDGQDTEEDENVDELQETPDRDDDHDDADPEADEDELEEEEYSMKIERELTETGFDEDEIMDGNSYRADVAAAPYAALPIGKQQAHKEESPEAGPSNPTQALSTATDDKPDIGLTSSETKDLITMPTAFPRIDAQQAVDAVEPGLASPVRIRIPSASQGAPVLTEDLMDVQDTQSDEDESSDDDGPPRVEITSKDPKAAARAAAILKLHHDYIEDTARRRLKRRSSALSLDTRDSPAPATPPARFETPMQRLRKRSSLGRVPISPDVLREAEAEVGTPRATADPPEAGSSREARYSTPVQRFPPVPIVIVDPASSRPSVDEARLERDDDRPWTKKEWKHLERCLLDERHKLATERGLSDDSVDVSELDINLVVDRFLNEESLIGDEEGWEGNGEWSRDKIRRRCVALQVRHTRQASGVVAIPGSPIVVPFTPLPSRQNTPLPLIPGETPSVPPRIPSPQPTTPAVVSDEQVEPSLVPQIPTLASKRSTQDLASKAVLPKSRSKEDLNHVEPQPGRIPTPPPHPKELVTLHPVPPKVARIATKPRRSSGSSVKDLIKTFELLEDENDRERERIRGLVRAGRLATSGDTSLRRVSSNLSISSMTSMEDTSFGANTSTETDGAVSAESHLTGLEASAVTIATSQASVA
ncbi:hypothetical protein FRB99_007925 [Tulasnella sp. 403]|nr:hypothetical protein FRB99_007925 [Tulasnella sp. 403]